MKKVILSDCTLYEGGYRNGWKFCEDKHELEGFLGELALVQTDIMSVGVLGNGKRVGGYYNSFDEIICPPINLRTKYAVTILDYEKFDLKSIKRITAIEYVRIVVTKSSSLCQLKKVCDSLKGIGYKIIIDIECELDDSESIVNELVLNVIENGVDIVVIDDVYGTLGNMAVSEILLNLNKKLNNGIGLGYRGRDYVGDNRVIVNNLISHIKERELVIDVSITGVSRNVCLPKLEIIVPFLNAKCNTTYDITRMFILADMLFRSVNNIANWEADQLSPMFRGVNTAYKNILMNMNVSSDVLEYILKCLKSTDNEKVNIRQCYFFAQEYRKKIYQDNLAIVVWIDEEGENLVERYINTEIANMVHCEVDIYFCNIFPGEKESKTIQKYKSIDAKNIYYLENNEGMISILKQLVNKYKYIWMNQSEYIIKYDKIDFYVPSLLTKDFDIIVLENEEEGGKKRGLYECRDHKEMFLNNFVKLYAMGTGIYSTKFLKKVFSFSEGDGVNSEMALVKKIFDYISYNEGKFANYYTDMYMYDKYNGLFGCKGYVEKWSVIFDKIVQELSCEYNEFKKDILTQKQFVYNPFSTYRVAYLRAKRADGIKQLKKLTTGERQSFTMIPSFICRYILKRQHGKLGMLYSKLGKKVKQISKYVRKKDKKCFGIDFGKYVNCVVPQKEVASKLVYGDLDYVHEPWMTIVIPTYKRSDLLEEAIYSVLEQEDISHPWDIVIVDNEATTDGQVTETETLIRKINNPKILYYRNEKNIGVAGNYNRGIELARGKWISLLHSDDLLVQGYLKRMEKLVTVYSRKAGKEIGYISSGYQSFFSECILADKQWATEIKRRNIDIAERQKKRSAILLRVRPIEFMITGAVGISLPSNGTVMNRTAILESGGFNDDLGICADMVLPLRLMKKYAVYRTDEIMGHYRVGKSNISASSDNAYKVEKNYYDIREYYYRQSLFGRIMGYLFRQQHFFMIDNILGKPYRVDTSLHKIYQYKKQRVRDFIMFGRYGIINQFYWIQRKSSRIKGRIMTKIFWKE